jgi:hypothetical protein
MAGRWKRSPPLLQPSPGSTGRLDPQVAKRRSSGSARVPILDHDVNRVLRREDARQAATERRYSEFDRSGKGRGLLVTAMDLLQEAQPGAQPRTAVERRFQAPTSMRDVEPSVHVYVDRKPAEEAS